MEQQVLDEQRGTEERVGAEQRVGAEERVVEERIVREEVVPPRPPKRRLVRSTRERMWAGVAGGMAEYFEVDPTIVRLIWVAAAVLTSGFAIAVYIALWIIMPREDEVDRRNATAPGDWRSLADQFRSDTERFAREARRMTADFTGRGERGSSPSAPAAERETVTVTTTTAPTDGEAPREASATATDTIWTPPGAATRKSEPAWYGDTSGPLPTSAEWDAPRRDVGYVAPPRREEGSRQRTAGFVLVALGVLFLANEIGLFRWIDWGLMWPLILVGIGVALLVKQRNGRR